MIRLQYLSIYKKQIHFLSDSKHWNLDAKTGVFTFIGIAEKKNPRKKDLSRKMYMTAELYNKPRC